MTIRSRGEIGQLGDIIQLRTAFYSQADGYLVDLNAYPQVSIQQPSGNVIMPFTSAGVYRVSTGIYGWDYTVGKNDTFGVWTDNWMGMYQAYKMYQSYNFVINFSQMPEPNTDGYMHLGDDIGYNFSQNAICNIDKLMKGVKARLNSGGKTTIKDSFGNKILVDCNIYTDDQIITFLIFSLSYFNGIPHFTSFTFEDTDFCDRWGAWIVQRAVIDALYSKALIERGREFDISDSGTTFKPPSVSELLSSEAGTELSNWTEAVKMIKASMKPVGIGLGSASTLGASASPAVRRLRHLRSRQVI